MGGTRLIPSGREPATAHRWRGQAEQGLGWKGTTRAELGEKVSLHPISHAHRQAEQDEEGKQQGWRGERRKERQEVGGTPSWPLSMSEGGGLAMPPWVASHAAMARELIFSHEMASVSSPLP